MPDLLKSNNSALFNPESEIQLANSIFIVSKKKWDPKAVRKTVEELTCEFAAKKYLSIIKGAI